MSSRHPVRRALNQIGIDVHRHHASPEPLAILTTLDIKTIIDVGANVGQFAQEVRALLPDATMYSFEPLPDCFAELTARMKGDANFHAFNTALGETSGTATIHRSSYSPSSSLLPMEKLHTDLFPHTKGGVDETIRIECMDDALAGLPLAPNVLLKIDAQGYEEQVLAGGPATLAQTKVALLEASFVRLYEGQPLFDRVYTLMKDAGFSYRGALHQKRDPVTGAILFEDALFIRA
ncbi:MAG TPA: FkbM family methyltransferase [Candidatus Paceibacterota bacterium]|nr:FkbM family methyltransferase [Candidatus Paceibacterota bacterium]